MHSDTELDGQPLKQKVSLSDRIHRGHRWEVHKVDSGSKRSKMDMDT